EGLTGRTLVVLEPGQGPALTSALRESDIRLAVASEFVGGMTGKDMKASDAVLFDHVSTLLVPGASAVAASLISACAREGRVRAVEKEGYVYAIGAPAPSRTSGLYRLGVLSSEEEEDRTAARLVEDARFRESDAAWGLQAIGADRSTLTGEG